ncbi:MAG TPA: DUF5663 domain-containing protein [Candidatus Saccharimonadales bacterium]
MFRLDDQFLKDIGLDGLPDEQKKPFLQHIYSELELRVGTRLSDGLSDAQLEEFEEIIDRKEDKIQSWLADHAPTYSQEPAFAKLMEATKLPANDPRLVAEYTATKWLEVNRPDYRDVVAAVLEELKKEIMGNRDAILGGIQAQAAEQQVPPAGDQQPPMQTAA